MADKVFKTHDELIALLSKRGMDISTPTQKSFAKKGLQHHGYYNIINGYKTLFLDSSNTSNEDQYKPGTTFDQVYSLYLFDQKLRLLFLKYILEIEINVKSLIAYIFPQKYSYNNYLLYSNFDTNRKDANRSIPALIADIHKLIANRTNDPCIVHYISKYGYIPLWVLNNILTFGNISKFYSLMKQPERQYVSKTFHMSDAELESALFYLTKVRNFCAHGNRLYCFRNNTPYIDTIHHNTLCIPKKNGEFEYGKRDMFATMIILKDLLSKNDYKVLIKKLNKYIHELNGKLVVISEADILNSLGFPIDWKSKLLKL